MRLHPLLVVAFGCLVVFAIGCGEDDGINWDEGHVFDGSGGTPPVGGGGGLGGSNGPPVDFDGSAACPPLDAPDVTLVAEDLTTCSETRWTCSGDTVPFWVSCGCGCVPRGLQCPDPDDPLVDYQSQRAGGCDGDPLCLPGQASFDDACGCGCIGEPTQTCDEGRLFAPEPEVFEPEAVCPVVVVCLDGAPSSDLRAQVLSQWTSAECDADPHPSCGSTGGSCRVSRGVLTQADVDRACRLLFADGVDRIGCALEP